MNIESGYKSNIQKAVALLYKNNEWKEIKKTTPLKIIIK